MPAGRGTFKKSILGGPRRSRTFTATVARGGCLIVSGGAAQAVMTLVHRGPFSRKVEHAHQVAERASSLAGKSSGTRAHSTQHWPMYVSSAVVIWLQSILHRRWRTRRGPTAVDLSTSELDTFNVSRAR
ncbi:hypothetical protein PLICRDRAFT_283678 [Plicaturopsis crispa FD-325 SS-3]|nr:hypothetical protein PLICRDRAFT_283678 [Plicaturopsis crispa FD-325 SS-3]